MKEKILNYLNDNMVEPDEHITKIASLFHIKFIDEKYGWQPTLHDSDCDLFPNENMADRYYEKCEIWEERKTGCEGCIHDIDTKKL
jgi:hypothetical protein